MSTREVLILGLETSCDETAAAVVRSGAPGRGGDVLANIISSQHELHAEYRGVVPEIASRAHAERITPILRAAIEQAGIHLLDISAVAVGHRPGLIGSLLVGVAAAKALAWTLEIPLVGIDHVQAHLYAGCLDADLPAYPALGLVVSGGHTALYRCQSPIAISRLGKTIDDAVGEAYDKAATILGLPYPGGPNLDRLAASATASTTHGPRLPVSRLGPRSLDFSFSGLKTAMLYAVKGVPARAGEPAAPAPKLDNDGRAALAAAFQKAAVDAVVLKLRRALEQHPDCRTLLVGGGVSANSRLRAELQRLGRDNRLDLRLPKLEYCLDNAAMIAGLAGSILAARGWSSDPLSLAAEPTATA